MCDLFGGSSPTTAQSSSSSAQSTTVNVTSNTSIPVTLDTASLADALQSLAGSNTQAAALNAAASIYQTKTQAATALQTNGPSWSTILLVGSGLFGLLLTAGIIKIPKAFEA